MSSPTPLPTRVRFLADIEIVYTNVTETCDICHGAFDRGAHKAARTICQHIFGLSCLTRWVYTNAGQSNTCPKCRRALFVNPPNTPVFASGYRSDRSYYYSLDMCTSPVLSRTIVLLIWRKLRELNPQYVIYDGDIEVKILSAGKCIVERFGVLFFRIDPTHLVNLRDVAKDMIKEQAETRDIFEYTSVSGVPVGRVKNLESVWLPRVAEVFGWQLEEAEIHREHIVRFADSQWRFDV